MTAPPNIAMMRREEPALVNLPRSAIANGHSAGHISEQPKAISEIMQKNFSRKIVIPITIVVICLFLFIANWNKMFKNAQMSDTANMICTFGIPVIYLIGMLFVRKTIINNITKEQQNALQKIKDFFGEVKYEKLLKEQRTYIDDYFDAHSSDEELEIVDTNETKEETEKKDASVDDKEETQEENEATDVEIVEK